MVIQQISIRETNWAIQWIQVDPVDSATVSNFWTTDACIVLILGENSGEKDGGIQNVL